jgi:integrase
MEKLQAGRATGHLQVKGTRGNRSFYALIRDADGRHQRKLGPAWVKDSGKRTERGAIRWATRDGSKPDGYLTPVEASDMLREMLAGAPRPERPTAKTRARVMTLRQACDHWLEWAENDSEVKHSTLGDYRNVCDRICRDLGATARISAITSRQIERWITELKAERRLSPTEAKRRRRAGIEIRKLPDDIHVQLTPASPRTKRKYLVNLNGILNRAIKLDAIDENPVRRVERPGRLRKRNSLATSQFLRHTEVHALVRAARAVSEQDAAMYLTSAFCGLRLGELLGLRWGAVDFKASAIHVETSYVRNIEDTPKSSTGRTVPMAPDVATALKQHEKTCARKGARDLVFTGRAGRHVDGNTLRNRYYAALTDAGLERIRIHDLRHTFKEWMGHADLATTEIYTAYYPQTADAAKISAAFADVEPNNSAS